MSFKDQISLDVKNVFLNNDEFAETVEYIPKTGWAKKIKALVVREQLEENPQSAGGILSRQYEIYIANDEASGVDKVTKGEDRVLLAPHVGEECEEFAVVDIISKDDAMWRLAIQR